MKRRKRIKKSTGFNFKKYLAVVFVIITILSVIGLGFFSVYKWLVNSPIFEIKEIALEGQQEDVSVGQLFDLMNEKNIFKINLASYSKKIRTFYWPQFKEVNVRKVFPSKLEIAVSRHLPIAQIKGYRYYFIDGQGLVLKPAMEQQHPEYPVILLNSLAKNKVNIDFGKYLHSYHVMNPIKFLKRSKRLLEGRYNIENIIAIAEHSISFKLEGYPFTIRISDDDIDKSLKRLITILQQYEGKYDGIRYIDLRFEGKPIVSLR